MFINRINESHISKHINVAGIIVEICEIRKIKSKNDLSLRNIWIIDKTNTKLRIALWGKDAEKFKADIGTVIMIYNGFVTKFEGFTLSVIKKSYFVLCDENDASSVIDDIREWYRNVYLNITEGATGLKRDISENHNLSFQAQRESKSRKIK